LAVDLRLVAHVLVEEAGLLPVRAVAVDTKALTFRKTGPSSFTTFLDVASCWPALQRVVGDRRAKSVGLGEATAAAM
jgi:hypothetical protein